MYVGAVICCNLVLKEVLANFDEQTQLRKTPDTDIFSNLVVRYKVANLVLPLTENLKLRQVNCSDESTAKEKRREELHIKEEGRNGTTFRFPLPPSFSVLRPLGLLGLWGFRAFGFLGFFGLSGFRAICLSGFGLNFKRNLLLHFGLRSQRLRENIV